MMSYNFVVITREKATNCYESKKKHSQKKRVHWQYRFVLTAFTLLSLGFGYLLWQQGESAGRLQGTAPIEPGTTTNWSISTA